MSLASIFIGFLWALFYCVLVVLVALAFKWAIEWLSDKPLPADFLKWGKAAVGLLCAIIMITWLLSSLGILTGGAASFYQPRIFHQ